MLEKHGPVEKVGSVGPAVGGKKIGTATLLPLEVLKISLLWR